MPSVAHTQPVDDALNLTLGAMVARRWRIVLCRPRSKEPAAASGQSWPIAIDPEPVRRWIEVGGKCRAREWPAPERHHPRRG
jgi:hypothetical protein